MGIGGELMAEFEVCEGCDATDMDELACDNQHEFCLECCGCPDHVGGGWRD